MAPSTIGTLGDTPNFGSNGATLHALAVDSKINDSLPSTTMFACESSSIYECRLSCAFRAVIVAITGAIEAEYPRYYFSPKHVKRRGLTCSLKLT